MFMLIGCLPLSQVPGRCGSDWGGRCNMQLRNNSLYCNMESGQCDDSEEHKNAQPNDIYDWKPQSCSGNIPIYITRLITMRWGFKHK